MSWKVSLEILRSGQLPSREYEKKGLALANAYVRTALTCQFHQNGQPLLINHVYHIGSYTWEPIAQILC